MVKGFTLSGERMADVSLMERVMFVGRRRLVLSYLDTVVHHWDRLQSVRWLVALGMWSWWEITLWVEHRSSL